MGDWTWDGGRLAVDLVNTVRGRAGEPRETLRDPADLALWLSEAGLYDGDADQAHLRAARALRDAIDALMFSSGGPLDGPVAVVNAAAAETTAGPRLAVENGRLVAAPPPASVAGALGVVALDAVDLLTGDDLLRVCAADDCGVRFVDRSPARNRQWCSMRRCGNRTKARRHYARTGA
jgi:predicted RNA-binding Zn ribbon-like protein